MSPGAYSGGGAPEPRPPLPQERKREKGIKYVHQEGMAANTVETVLMSFFVPPGPHTEP